MKKKLSPVPCPFCGKLPEIVVEDDEGNVHRESEYEKDPWSGLWYAIKHYATSSSSNCLIADNQEDGDYSRDIGNTAFSSYDEAVEFWNNSLRKVGYDKHRKSV